MNEVLLLHMSTWHLVLKLRKLKKNRIVHEKYLQMRAITVGGIIMKMYIREVGKIDSILNVIDSKMTILIQCYFKNYIDLTIFSYFVGDKSHCVSIV